MNLNIKVYISGIYQVYIRYEVPKLGETDENTKIQNVKALLDESPKARLFVRGYLGGYYPNKKFRMTSKAMEVLLSFVPANTEEVVAEDINQIISICNKTRTQLTTSQVVALRKVYSG